MRSVDNEVVGDSLFYKHNVFGFDRVENLAKYLRTLKPAQKASLRTVRLQHTNNANSIGAFEALSLCSGLRDLTLDITQLCMDGSLLDQSIAQTLGYDQLMSLRDLKRFEFWIKEDTKIEFANVAMQHSQNTLTPLQTRDEVYAILKGVQDMISDVVCSSKVEENISLVDH